MHSSYISAFFLPSVALGALSCRPEGPVLPKVPLSSISSSPIIAAAAANLTSTLDAALDGSINAGFDTVNASFSIALVSAHQDDPGVPLWEYHHLSEANVRGTKELDRDSQYLIGSISKAVSDYIMLQTGVDIDRSVTEFLPVLAEPGSRIEWKDVSLRMLASHLSGAPTNCESFG
jgi:CubicO group peptidase (beta-lactamase class C family)